jgi:hypothetical protein
MAERKMKIAENHGNTGLAYFGHAQQRVQYQAKEKESFTTDLQDWQNNSVRQWAIVCASGL